ncbi:MAG: hypothetical protein ABIG89_00215 [Candidatus Woesearchaeota archaeon]
MAYENLSFFEFIDLVLSNVSKENTPKFLSEVKRVLTSNGFFVTRIYYIPDDWKFKSAEEVFDFFENQDQEKKTNDRSQEMFTFFLCNSFDPKTNELYTCKILEQIKPYWNKELKTFQYPKSKYVESLLNNEYKMWEPFNKVWHGGNKEYVYSTLLPYFEVLEEKPANDHHWAKEFPIILCRLK